MSPDLVVVCWLWSGWRKGVYRAEHVNTLAHMVAKNLKMPHRFVCVTDNPRGIQCETMKLWDDPIVKTDEGRPNSYRRLKVFSPGASKLFKAKYILSLDLDCVILGELDPLLDFSLDFRMLKGYASPYNGSMIYLELGKHPSVWTKFHPIESPRKVQRHEGLTQVRHFGSDQAWISYMLRNKMVWCPEDGVYQFTRLKGSLPEDVRVLFFAGRHKPWHQDVKARQPRAYHTYMQAMAEAHNGSSGIDDHQPCARPPD